MQRFLKKQKNIMKRLFQLLVIAGMATFIACGPSAEQKAEKAKQDSIRKADSIAALMADSIRKADSINALGSDSLRKADSAKKADSIAATTKKGKKK